MKKKKEKVSIHELEALLDRVEELLEKVKANRQALLVELMRMDDVDSGGFCLHDNCSICGGTGRRRDGLGMCIHSISCSCPKCSIR